MADSGRNGTRGRETDVQVGLQAAILEGIRKYNKFRSWYKRPITEHTINGILRHVENSVRDHLSTMRDKEMEEVYEEMNIMKTEYMILKEMVSNTGELDELTSSRIVIAILLERLGGQAVYSDDLFMDTMNKDIQIVVEETDDEQYILTLKRGKK